MLLPSQFDTIRLASSCGCLCPSHSVLFHRLMTMATLMLCEYLILMVLVNLLGVFSYVAVPVSCYSIPVIDPNHYHGKNSVDPLSRP